MSDVVGEAGSASRSCNSKSMALGTAFWELFESIPAGAVLVDELGNILAVNAELSRQFDYPPNDLVGTAIERLVPADRRVQHVPLRSDFLWSARVRTMGSGQVIHGQKRDGSTFRIEVGLRPFQRGPRRLVLAIVSDLSERERTVALEAKQQHLNQELAHQEAVAREMAHRIKNLLATVAALASLSARGAKTPKEMEESLRGRIFALSAVVDLAFRGPELGSTRGLLSIEEILRAILAPFSWPNLNGERISLSGPRFPVKQRSSEVLALVFHELATNAIKYGSLRHPEGRLRVDWLEDGDQLELSWREEATDFVAAGSASKGFGSSLISRMIETELGGQVDRQIAAGGWIIGLSVPVASLVSQ